MARDGSGSNFNPVKPSRNHPWRTYKPREVEDWAKEQSTYKPVSNSDGRKKKGQR